MFRGLWTRILGVGFMEYRMGIFFGGGRGWGTRRTRKWNINLKTTGMLEDSDMGMPPKDGRIFGIGYTGIVRG